MPRALYKKLRSSRRPNNDPCIMTARAAEQSSYQVSDFVLCRECEQRLSRNGESYVMGLLPKGGGRFPLLEALQRSHAYEKRDDWAVYHAIDSPQINREQLIYFGISIFWRASVYTWRLKGRKPIRIELGSRYNEELRLYLLGQTLVPERAHLIARVCTDLAGRNFMFPPIESTGRGPRRFGFFACGLDLGFCITKTPSEELQLLSVTRWPDQPILTFDWEKDPRWAFE